MHDVISAVSNDDVDNILLKIQITEEPVGELILLAVAGSKLFTGVGPNKHVAELNVVNMLRSNCCLYYDLLKMNSATASGIINSHWNQMEISILDSIIQINNPVLITPNNHKYKVWCY